MRPLVVALDSNGNLYVADANGNRVVKVAPGGAPDHDRQRLSTPESVAVDAAGNVYVANGGGAVDEITPSLVLMQLAAFGFPVAIAVDGVGNVYVGQGAQVVELTRGTPPTLQFLASDPVGSKSPDSPITLTLNNIGNSAVTFAVPTSGANPTVSPSSYSLESGSTCPQLTTTSSAATLNPGATCNYLVDFTPASAGIITGSIVLTDNALNATNATQTIPLNNNGTPALNQATVTVNTTVANYTGSPIPGHGHHQSGRSFRQHPLRPIRRHTDQPRRPLRRGLLQCLRHRHHTWLHRQRFRLPHHQRPPQTTPTITWPTPAPINAGTALSATQLDATTTVPGTFTYSIASGTVLAPGSYAVKATFTPTDTIDYTTATQTDTIVVQTAVQPVTPSTSAPSRSLPPAPRKR